jgi:hypothetical protein
VPVSPLPENPSFENLRKRARGLLEAVRAGDAEALARVREHHPRAEEALERPSLAAAQLVLARSYGFPSWPKLKRHLEDVERFACDPLAQAGPETAADAFARLACLDYGRWERADAEEARRRLTEDPGLSKASVAAAAAAGDVAGLRAFLDRDGALVDAPCGPHRWPPLLYACYSRVEGAGPGDSTLETGRLLLARGADPNAGFLWRGNIPPFTALTGAFGEGEGGASQPPHPHRDALARLLLDAGADPNDGQVLYNRHFRADDGHLELLLARGLGKDQRGPWFARFSEKLQSPERLLVEELWAAARMNYRERARLLVEHGAPLDTPGFRDGRTPYESAMLAGNVEIAEDLVRHGARLAELGPAAAFEAACVAGRREEAKAALAKDPAMLERLGHDGRVRLVHRAVEANRLEGVRLMAELGFEVGAWTRHDGAGINLATTPLHNAAWMGNLEMVRLLVEVGADPEIQDPRFRATPLGWAQYNGKAEVAEYLKGLAERK